MKHEKTFEAITKLKDIEVELHRLKNALEMANKALDAQRQWVGLTPQERDEINEQVYGAVPHYIAFHAAIEAKLRSKNSA